MNPALNGDRLVTHDMCPTTVTKDYVPVSLGVLCGLAVSVWNGVAPHVALPAGMLFGFCYEVLCTTKYKSNRRINHRIDLNIAFADKKTQVQHDVESGLLIERG